MKKKRQLSIFINRLMSSFLANFLRLRDSSEMLRRKRWLTTIEWLVSSSSSNWLLWRPVNKNKASVETFCLILSNNCPISGSFWSKLFLGKFIITLFPLFIFKAFICWVEKSFKALFGSKTSVRNTWRRRQSNIRQNFTTISIKYRFQWLIADYMTQYFQLILVFSRKLFNT